MRMGGGMKISGMLFISLPWSGCNWYIRPIPVFRKYFFLEYDVLFKPFLI